MNIRKALKDELLLKEQFKSYERIQALALSEIALQLGRTNKKKAHKAKTSYSKLIHRELRRLRKVLELMNRNHVALINRRLNE
jgi:hypothetical protein